MDLKRAEGRILLLYRKQKILPIPRLRIVRKSAFEDLLLKALADPRGMADHTKRAKGFRQDERSMVERAEHLITFKKILLLFPLFVFVAKKQHPDVLNRGRHHHVVKVNECGAILVPQNVSKMAIAMHGKGFPVLREKRLYFF